MAKSQLYEYKKDGVVLSFSFKEDENIARNKVVFVDLMHQAIKDLNKEIDNN